MNPEATKTEAVRMSTSLKNALQRAGFVRHRKKHVKTRRTQWYKPIPEGTTPMTGQGLDAVRDIEPPQNNRREWE
jgi:hypothetical protein